MADLEGVDERGMYQKFSDREAAKHKWSTPMRRWRTISRLVMNMNLWSKTAQNRRASMTLGQIDQLPSDQQHVDNGHHLSVIDAAPQPTSVEEDSENEDESTLSAVSLEFRRLMQLQDMKGKKLFSKYLAQQYADENMLFYNACMGVRVQKQVQAYEMLCRDIYNTFIRTDATLEVNIAGDVKAQIEEDMKQTPLPRHMYTPARKHIYKLMEKDSFGRFRQMQQYKDYKATKQ